MLLKRSILSLSLAVTIAIGLAGCGRGGSSADASRVIAEVNGEKISDSNFQSYLQYKRIPNSDAKAADAALADYLQREGLAQVILSQKVLDSQRIETEVNEFRKQMLISRYFEQYLKEHVTEEAVRNFYASNAERFQSKKAHVAHVLIRTNPKMTEQEREVLLTKAQEVYSKAMSNEAFEKLAQQYSDDSLSAKKGGDLGWITQESIDPAFVKAAFALKSGEVSAPVTTAFGFHVIKVLEEAQVVKKPYESVKGDIRFELRQQAKAAEQKRLESLVSIEKRG